MERTGHKADFAGAQPQRDIPRWQERPANFHFESGGFESRDPIFPAECEPGAAIFIDA